MTVLTASCSALLILLAAPATQAQTHSAHGDLIPASELQAISQYTFGGSRKALTALEAAIRNAAPNGRSAVENVLLRLLQSREATTDCKRYVCAQLGTFGSDRTVPRLEGLLLSTELGDSARMALEKIASTQARAALRNALHTAEGRHRVGLINSLATLRDEAAAPAFARLSADAAPDVAAAAVAGLAGLGTPEALEALSGPDGPLAAESPQVVAARLACATRVARRGDPRAALAVFDSYVTAGHADSVRSLAAVGITEIRGAEALPLVEQLLNARSSILRETAAKCARILPPSTDTTRSLSARLPALDTHAKVLLLAALAERGNAAAEADIIPLIGNGEDAVRHAAFRALAILGRAPAARAALQALLAGSSAAATCLKRIPDPAADRVLLEHLNGCVTCDQTAAIIQVLLSRGTANCTPALLQAATAGTDAVSREACKAIGKLGGAGDLPRLVRALCTLSKQDRLETLRTAIAAVAARDGGAEACLDAVQQQMPQAGVACQCSLLWLIGRLGQARSIPTVVAALDAGDPRVREAAIRALAEWPDPTPADRLLTVAQSAANLVHHVLCLRGYLRMAELVSADTPKKGLRMCEKALAAARRDEEKELVEATWKKIATAP